MPETSVILPTYNRAETLPRAIDSVLAQDYEDFELIIVDDASTDHTPEVIDHYADDRIQFHQLSENTGSAGARNEGLSVANGKFVAFQDSDDRWLPQKLSRQIEMMKDAPSKVGVVYAAGRNFDAGETIRVPSPVLDPVEGDVYDLLLYNMFVNIHSLVRYESVEQVGFFDEDLTYYEDWDFFLRLAERYHFRYIAEPLAEWHRGNDKERSTNKQKYDRSLNKMFEKHASDYRRVARNHLAPALSDESRSILVWGAGRAGYSFARMIEPLDFELDGFVDISPDKQGTTIAGIPVIAPRELDELKDPFVVVKSLHAGDIVAELQDRDYIREDDFCVL